LWTNKKIGTKLAKNLYKKQSKSARLGLYNIVHCETQTGRNWVIKDSFQKRQFQITSAHIQLILEVQSESI